MGVWKVRVVGPQDSSNTRSAKDSSWWSVGEGYENSERRESFADAPPEDLESFRWVRGNGFETGARTQWRRKQEATALAGPRIGFAGAKFEAPTHGLPHVVAQRRLTLSPEPGRFVHPY